MYALVNMWDLEKKLNASWKGILTKKDITWFCLLNIILFCDLQKLLAYIIYSKAKGSVVQFTYHNMSVTAIFIDLTLFWY